MNIKDIAKLAGVSSATVSRVLNNSGPVKEDTRKRILKIVEESKFIPNAVARNLSNESLINNIGLIVPNIDNPFFATIAKGVSAAADEYGYNVFLFSSSEDAEKELRFLKTSWEQRLRGILLTPVVENDTVNRSFMLRLPIPVVVVDREVYDTSLDGVFSDDVEGSYNAVETLIRSGHTRIAQIIGPLTTKPGRDRLEGYRRALHANGIPIRDEYVVEGRFQQEDSYIAMQKLMKLKNPPTAIFCANNMTSLGALKYMKENGIRLGKDISMIGYDDIEALQYTDLNLTTVSRPVEEMGYEAMMLLHERINTDAEKRNGVRKRIHLGTQLILRGSECMDGKHPKEEVQEENEETEQ